MRFPTDRAAMVSKDRLCCPDDHPLVPKTSDCGPPDRLSEWPGFLRKSANRWKGFLGQPLKSRPGDPKSPRCLSCGQASHLGEAFRGDATSGATQLHALCFRPCQPRLYALLNPAPLKFGQSGENMKLKLPCGRRAVDPLPIETNAMPSAWSSSSSVIRCRRLRPSRSSRQQTSTSN